MEFVVTPEPGPRSRNDWPTIIGSSRWITEAEAAATGVPGRITSPRPTFSILPPSSGASDSRHLRWSGTRWVAQTHSLMRHAIRSKWRPSLLKISARGLLKREQVRKGYCGSFAKLPRASPLGTRRRTIGTAFDLGSQRTH